MPHHDGPLDALKRMRSRLGLRRQARRLAGVRWYGTDNPEQAARALCTYAAKALRETGRWALCVGDESDLRQRLTSRLATKKISHRVLSLDHALALPPADAGGIGVILCADVDARKIQSAADALRHHPILARVPFEYVVGLEPERQIFRDRDEYADARFVSPLLIDEVPVHDIYEDSLQHFEQKCGLRDYLDLFQCLKSVIERGISGDIAEFGSYKGHSGYLLARLLQHLDPSRHLFLFDTFEHFPDEPLGLDRFWSRTHDVDFDTVKARFQDFHGVHFERGDFTQTLASSSLGSIALAYVDSDAYRSVRYLAGEIWAGRLADGGMMVFEDYGHPALLGARSAIHEFFEGRSDCVRWYSHFSGLYIAVKTGNS